MTAKRKKTFIIAAIIAAVTICYLVISLLPRGNNYSGDNPMMKDERLPILIAHGGGNKEFPDNTLEAFYNAYSVDERVMMETDVSITKDGVVILSHDTTLDRKTNVTGNISDWNYSDLIRDEVDFGYANPTEGGKLSGERKKYTSGAGEEKTPLDVSYPDGISPRHESVFLATTLEELIVAFPDNRINVEIKQSGELGKSALCEVLRLLEKHDAFDRVVLAASTYNAGVFTPMREFIAHLTERGFKNRTVALIENGSWAPMAAKVMKASLGDGVTYLDRVVKISSSVKEDTLRELDALASELAAL